MLKLKENLIPLIITAALSSVIFLGTNIFHFNVTGYLFILSVILFSFIYLFIWSMAGVAVLKSLLGVNVALSLMIFLSQSYCNLPDAAHTGDDALKSLFGFGLLCIIYIFIKSLNKELAEAIKIFKDIHQKNKVWIVIMTVLFVVSVVLFVWQLYQVLYPVISNLCMYKKI